jgi:pimeloyl-ACP methyl ester carboxylesterase
MAAQLDFDRRGAGEPILLLHGIGSHWEMWTPVHDRLARERDVVSISLPGFGRSAPLDGEPPTVAALARAVATFAREELGLERAHVAGNSLGGWIALELARTGFARSACGLSPAGFWNGPELAYTRTSLRVLRAAAERLAPRAGGIARTAAGRTALFAQVVARPWQMEAGEAARGLRNLAHSPGFHATLDHSITGAYDRAARLDGVPVTIAWGALDALLLPWQRRRAQAWIPGAEVIGLRACGHVPTYDDPAAVARVLLGASARG